METLEDPSEGDPEGPASEPDRMAELVMSLDETNMIVDDAEQDLRDYESKSELHILAEIIGGLPISRLYDLRIIDHRRDIEVSHRDIGVGISQVLPVLVGALTLDGLLAIEQPELHLHPALQAELGDLFIKSALKHKLPPESTPDVQGTLSGNLVLESHSEHLILRIMRRMRETANGTLPEGIPPITPEDVALLFVEPGPDGSGSVVRHLQLSEDGELLDPWPGGFFDKGFNERFS